MKRGLIGCALGAALILAALSTLPASADQVASGEDLYILTSQDAGTAAYDGPLSTADYRRTLVAEQDATLASLGIDKPVYRWTTALSGVAVELDTGDAVRASRMEGWSVEKDTVRLLAGASSDPTSAPTGSASTATPSAGQGTVIGFVDTGISPDSPAFASTPSLGEQPRRFRGPCQAGEGWTARDCDNKVSGARWFVKGFGEDQLRSGASLSPRDDHGHGTQVASVAAGNADVTALAGNENLGTFSGTAPGARIAAYKACWTAPDPADDGCSTADVVSAVDRAVRDRVDVLNLSIAGEQGFDVVDRATLGAAEADIVVTAAAGNTDAPTGNEQPWMTTVGAASGRDLGGQLRLPDGSAITGVLTSPTLPRAARLVRAADAPAPGHTRQQARLCAPGSLDAAKVDGRIVICERGTTAKVSKSDAVELADGVAMVLVNGPGDTLGADFHSVPTLHVSAEEGKELLAALKDDKHMSLSLARAPGTLTAGQVLDNSSTGLKTGTALKPDLVADGFGVLAANSPLASNRKWQLLNGTSAAAAQVSGLAARVRARHTDWSAAQVRSALTTSAEAAADGAGVHRQGAGIADDDATRPGLVLDVDPAEFRAAIDKPASPGLADYSRINLASVQVPEATWSSRVVTRTLTNVGTSNMYFSSSATGFRHHAVTVSPAALKIPPGASREIEIRIPARKSAKPDSGVVTWRGANGTSLRIPVAITR